LANKEGGVLRFGNAERGKKGGPIYSEGRENATKRRMKKKTTFFILLGMGRGKSNCPPLIVKAGKRGKIWLLELFGKKGEKTFERSLL